MGELNDLTILSFRDRPLHLRELLAKTVRKRRSRPMIFRSCHTSRVEVSPP